MPEATLRNPTGRWAIWLATGVVLTLVVASMAANLGTGPCLDDAGQPCKISPAWVIVLFFGPFPLGFLLAAWSSARARTTVTAAGLRVRGFLTDRLYPWREIRQVVNHTERWYGSGVRMSTERSIRIQLTSGKIRHLPAPKAGWFLGRQAFEDGVGVVFTAWQRGLTLDNNS